MQYLGVSLDDPEAAECGRCASCRGEPVVSLDILPETLGRAQRFLRRSEFAMKLRVQCPPGAFAQYGWSGNLPPQLRADEAKCLSRWGDVGWGRVVMDGKRDGHFGDPLVEAASAMILERWQPAPSPSWVTCVPSLRHPELVADFARRLAESLGLRFLPVVTKRRETEPQKMMENSSHQARNLDGVFDVDAEDVLMEPVLLVDDVIDSRWTLTVITALLREAGVPAVHPVALASTGYR